MNKKVNQKLAESPVAVQDLVCITAEADTAMTYHVFIDEDIEEISYYRNLLTLLGSANDTDTIVFHLSTAGGQLETAIAITNGIRSTLARTISVIEGTVASAGTIFPMVTDGVVVMPHGVLMFHSASYGYVSEMKGMKGFVDFQDARLRKILHDFYQGFFSEEEINSMIDSRMEIYMEEEEIISRLTKRSSLLEAMADAEIELGLAPEVEIPKKSRKKKTEEKE